MGYRIDYQPIKKVRGMEKRTTGAAAWCGVLLMLTVLLVQVLWPEGPYYLRRILFSGDLSVTSAAIDNLTNELHNGETFAVALEVFCQTIIAGGSGAVG